jgi:hypothetical protein
MRMIGETHYADLRGPAACELLTDAEVEVIHARLGADPLRDDADPDRAWARISRSRAPLATLLMDQSVIAGVGNVYRARRCSARARPAAARSALTRACWDELWADLVDLLQDGFRRGKIETLRPEHDPRLVDGVGPCARRRTSTSAPASPAWSAARPSRTPATWPATCSGARCANVAEPGGRSRRTGQDRPVTPVPSTGERGNPFMRNDGFRTGSSSGTRAQAGRCRRSCRARSGLRAARARAETWWGRARREVASRRPGSGPPVGIA